MKTIQGQAEKIGNVQGISEIILIVNILINVFKLWWECKHKKPAATLHQKIQSGDFSIIERIVFRRIVTKEFGLLSLERRKEIEATIFEEAKKLTEEQISEMLNEVKE